MKSTVTGASLDVVVVGTERNLDTQQQLVGNGGAGASAKVGKSFVRDGNGDTPAEGHTSGYGEDMDGAGGSASKLLLAPHRGRPPQGEQHHHAHSAEGATDEADGPEPAWQTLLRKNEGAGPPDHEGEAVGFRLPAHRGTKRCPISRQGHVPLLPSSPEEVPTQSSYPSDRRRR